LGTYQALCGSRAGLLNSVSENFHNDGTSANRSAVTYFNYARRTGSAVLSYGFWQSEYGGRADVLGKTISIDRHPIEIVGVTEPGFNGTEVGASADVMVPLCAVTLIGNGYPRMLETNFYPGAWLQVIGRLKGKATCYRLVMVHFIRPCTSWNKRAGLQPSGKPTKTIDERSSIR